MGKNEQVLFTIQILCLTLKKSIAQAIGKQKKYKKKHSPENCPNSPPPPQKKNRGASLTWIL